MNKALLLAGLIGAAGVTGCHKAPFDRTQDPSGGGALGTFGSGNFVIFSSELKSGGGALPRFIAKRRRYRSQLAYLHASSAHRQLAAVVDPGRVVGFDVDQGLF